MDQQRVADVNTTVMQNRTICNLQSRCANCGEQHQTKNCIEFIKDGFTSKCCNCGGPHKSYFRGCEKRQEFLNIRRNLNMRDKRKYNQHPRSNNQWKDSYRWEVPIYSNVSQSSPNQPYISTTDRRDDNSYADTVENNNNNSQNNINNVQPTYNLNNRNNDSLFTFQEISDLVNDIVRARGPTI